MNPELDKMLGFSTEDVREMFSYYKKVELLSADCDIEVYKQWQDAVEQTTRSAVAPRVKALRQAKQMHKIGMQLIIWLNPLQQVTLHYSQFAANLVAILCLEEVKLVGHGGGKLLDIAILVGVGG